MTSNREKLVEVVVDTICINATAQRHPYDAAFAILSAINAAGFEVVPPAIQVEAADRIAALEAALRWINGMPLTGVEPDHPARVMQVIATRALEGKPHD